VNITYQAGHLPLHKDIIAGGKGDAYISPISFLPALTIRHAYTGQGKVDGSHNAEDHLCDIADASSWRFLARSGGAAVSRERVPSKGFGLRGKGWRRFRQDNLEKEEISRCCCWEMQMYCWGLMYTLLYFSNK
jgi:hypothetical protein